MSKLDYFLFAADVVGQIKARFNRVADFRAITHRVETTLSVKDLTTA